MRSMTVPTMWGEAGGRPGNGGDDGGAAGGGGDPGGLEGGNDGGNIGGGHGIFIHTLASGSNFPSALLHIKPKATSLDRSGLNW